MIEDDAYSLYIGIKDLQEAKRKILQEVEMLKEVNTKLIGENQDLLISQTEDAKKIERYKNFCTKLKALNRGLMKCLPSESQSKYHRTAEWLSQFGNDDNLDIPSIMSSDIENIPVNEDTVFGEIAEDVPISVKQEEILVSSEMSESEIVFIEQNEPTITQASAFTQLIAGSKSANWKKLEKDLNDKENEPPSAKRKNKAQNKPIKKTKGGIKINETVRNKDERKKLHAHKDGCCGGYYDQFSDNNQVDKISRHRAQFAEPCTPPGYWDTTFPPMPPTQE